MPTKRRWGRDIFHLLLLLGVTVVPAWGVLGVVALTVASAGILGLQLDRRTRLGWVLCAVPGPLQFVGLIVTPLPGWQRVLVGVAGAMQWAPLDPWLRWLCVLVVATTPLWTRQRHVQVAALVPALHLAGALAWPIGLDALVVVVAGAAAAACRWQGRHQQTWWCVALTLVGLNSSAAVTVVPWVLTSALVAGELTAVWCWWAVAAVLASGGYRVGAGVLLWPLLSAVGQVRVWDRRALGVLLLWCLLPVTGAVARLQTSLGLYGNAWSGDIVGFVDSQQRLVAQLPWAAFACLGVLGWALWRSSGLAVQDE
ncbi:MAG: hypothetical protein RLZZ297_587 [Chloroflexota bacterium]